jgi:hypothetical protein
MIDIQGVIKENRIMHRDSFLKNPRLAVFFAILGMMARAL